MELVRHVVNMKSLDEEWHLLPLGDIHYGNPAHDEQAFKAAVKRVKDNPNYLTIGMGDFVENNNVANERSLKTFDIEMLAKSKYPLVSQQMREFKKIWEPIAPKTIGFLIGNHEDRTMTHDEFRLYMTEPLGVKYLGDMAFIQLRFMYRNKPVWDYVIIATHSRFGGQMHGSVMNAAQRAINAYDCDVLLFGHTHFAFVSKQKRQYLDIKNECDESPQIKQKKIIIGNTGSFLNSHTEGYDAYTDKKIGSLRDVGTITLTFKPKIGDIYAHE